MGIDAVAVVRVQLSALTKGLGPGPDEGELQEGLVSLLGKSGTPLAARALEDATALHLCLPFSSAPEELAGYVRALLGPLLDAHRDARGVLVYPDVADPTATAYDDLVAELGEGADWVPVVAEGLVPEGIRRAPDESLGSMMGDIMGVLGGDMAELQRAMFSGDRDALLAARQRVEQKLSETGKKEALERAASQLMGGATLPRAALDAQAFEAHEEDDDADDPMQAMVAQAKAMMAGGLDLGALAEQARKVVQENPDLERQLREQLGMASPTEAEPRGGSDPGQDGGNEDAS